MRPPEQAGDRNSVVPAPWDSLGSTRARVRVGRGCAEPRPPWGLAGPCDPQALTQQPWKQKGRAKSPRELGLLRGSSRGPAWPAGGSPSRLAGRAAPGCSARWTPPRCLLPKCESSRVREGLRHAQAPEYGPREKTRCASLPEDEGQARPCRGRAAMSAPGPLAGWPQGVTDMGTEATAPGWPWLGEDP